MATTFNFRISDNGQPLYRQISDYFREEIRQEHLAAGDMLPSIRKLTRDLKVSRTTVEAAYEILIDQGYIRNLPNRGFRVSQDQPAAPSERIPHGEEKKDPVVVYNFSNNYVDTSTFDSTLWRRCINRVLHTPEALAGYGDPQGEPKLRDVLARYSYQSRGVVCRPEQILVGAGLQALLMILLPLLPIDEKRAGFEEPGFPQAEQIFNLMGWKTERYNPGVPSGNWPELLVISPTNPYKGRSLSEKERSNLIVATQFERVYLLEDDYNGEFRYLHRPVPALHSFGNREQIIYVGSFSRTMLPSLRISYLVLPEKLLPAYRAIAHRYNQTSSTVEQLALADYIAEGYLTRHVKKLRTRYRAKSNLLQEALVAAFGDKVSIVSLESGLHLHIALNCPGTAEKLAEKALSGGVKIMPVRDSRSGNWPEFLLSFAGIAQDQIRRGVWALKDALDRLE
jgi:GntR family transcriptional regulator/MocR family aminotransferase